jgi:hypothetical protein
VELQGSITINGRHYQKGDRIPWYSVYPFFLVHMAMFGASGFFLAYIDDGPVLLFLYMHGGIACAVYIAFYVVIFGIDRVKWMFINSGLGLFGIYAQIDIILSWFGRSAADFSAAVHFIPFLYYVLYTFLLHQMLLDATHSRSNPRRRQLVDALYIVASIVIYGSIWLAWR